MCISPGVCSAKSQNSLAHFLCYYIFSKSRRHTEVRLSSATHPSPNATVIGRDNMTSWPLPFWERNSVGISCSSLSGPQTHWPHLSESTRGFNQEPRVTYFWYHRGTRGSAPTILTLKRMIKALLPSRVHSVSVLSSSLDPSPS